MCIINQQNTWNQSVYYIVCKLQVKSYLILCYLQLTQCKTSSLTYEELTIHSTSVEVIVARVCGWKLLEAKNFGADEELEELWGNI